MQDDTDIKKPKKLGSKQSFAAYEKRQHVIVNSVYTSKLHFLCYPSVPLGNFSFKSYACLFFLSSVNFSLTYLEKCCCILPFWLHYISMPFVSPSHTFGALLNFEIKVKEVSLISFCCAVFERYVLIR